ncbi:MAG: hypothetical protein ACYC8T_06355 [Myxococcaceae bacterium]
MTSRRTELALAAAVLLAAGAASGASAEAIHLRYEASPECPDREAFEQQLRARFVQLRAAEPQQAARSFHVTLTRDDELFQGVLTVREADGQESSRSVSAARCEEVVSALALVAAAAIELRASRSPVGHRPGLDVVEPPPPPSPPRPPPPPRRGWGFGAGARFEVTGGASPRPLLGGAAFLELERAERPSPLFRAGVRFSPGQDVVQAGGAGARFELFAGHLEACPFQAQLGSPVSLRPCARLEAGVLTATGRGLRSAPPSAARPWVTPSAVGRVRVGGESAVSLDVEGALAFPLVRDHFYLGQDSSKVTVHQVPAVTVGAGVGLSVSIW